MKLLSYGGSKVILTKSNVGATLLYDEFIVYQSNQQLIKYLIIVKNDNY